jgi:hypothetical protein
MITKPLALLVPIVLFREKSQVHGISIYNLGAD